MYTCRKFNVRDSLGLYFVFQECRARCADLQEGTEEVFIRYLSLPVNLQLGILIIHTVSDR